MASTFTPMRRISFQLPPSHEGEPPLSSPPASQMQFQLPPSHEGEPQASYHTWKSLISTPALA